MAKPANRGVRGIRHSVPPGVLIGRKINGGIGAPEFVTFQQLSQFIASFSGSLAPAVPPSSTIVQAQTISGSGDVPLLSGITARVLNIVLTPGFWDVSASVSFNPNGAAASTFSDAIAAISMDPSVLPTPPNHGGYVEHTGVLDINNVTTLTTAVMRIVVTTPTPVWLLAQATFS